MPFVHLQVKSAYSLLSSSARIESIVKRASELGYTSIALTDENVMYGAIPFYKECIKHGIKPIIGLTVSVLTDEDDDVQSYPLVLLAKNRQGYQNLLKISSAVQSKSKGGIPKRWLAHYSKGLFGITPGRNGEIERQLLENKVEKAKELISQYLNLFEEHSFYLAIQNHGTREDNILQKGVLDLSHEMNVGIVATNDVQYIEQKDSFAHECLLSIKHGTKLSDEERTRLPANEFYLKSSREMGELFHDNVQALENSLHIAELCNLNIALGISALPKFPVPTNEPAEDYLARICSDGIRKRFQEPTDEHYDRLHFELDVIKRMNFSDYFLIVWDFMKYAHENGILTGPGRGSAAGSLVAYILFITDVDPIEHSLLFERFLNPERISMPDIDIDFPDNRRDEMIKYVAEKYGQLHVAQIITFGTLAARAALRDVGRVMGISVKEADYIAKQVPGRIGITLQQAYEESESLREYIDNIELGRKIFETAVTLEGLPRHTSTHAAGVVISEQPLTDLIAIQDGHNDVYLTQFSMDVLEEIGLLKMDFLGLRNLTLLDNILSLIKRKTGKKIELSKIPLQDAKTFSLLSNGDTTGIFQLESSGMRSVLTRLQPTEFEDIVAVNALYRPGPMENIPQYIARKHKREEIDYPHPDLESLLASTYGVIVYQEQIMQIASKMAGFRLGEADLLRRAVSKKKKEVLDKERVHFVQGCLQKGYSEKVAHDIYDLIVRFANYGFNRSHAVAYSLIAYYLAYLKANYPFYFVAALLTSAIGNDDKLAQYIQEARQKNITILTPSINRSGFPFIVEQKGIRYSLAAIKNVGVSALKEILGTRKKKPFSDLFDFCVRTSIRNVNRRTIESLICSGAFDEFGEDRATLLATIDVAIEHAELVNPSNNSDQINLFVEEDFGLKPKYVKVEPFQTMERLSFEKESLGFYLSGHPVSAYSDALRRAGTTLVCNLSEYVQKKVRLGVFVTKSRNIRTKKGEVMAFVTLSDETGDVDAVAFPNVYKKNGKLFQNGELLFVEGNIDVRNNQVQLLINNVKPLQEVIKDEEQTLYLRIDSSIQPDEELPLLKAILKQHAGTTSVVLFYEGERKTIKLQSEYNVTPNQECLEQLAGLLGTRNVVLK